MFSDRFGGAGPGERSAWLYEVREVESKAIDHERVSERGVRGQHRLARSRAFPISVAQSIARDEPDPGISRLREQLEHLGARPEEELAVILDPSEVLDLSRRE